jgi:hypothetical protein
LPLAYPGVPVREPFELTNIILSTHEWAVTVVEEVMSSRMETEIEERYILSKDVDMMLDVESVCCRCFVFGREMQVRQSEFSKMVPKKRMYESQLEGKIYTAPGRKELNADWG